MTDHAMALPPPSIELIVAKLLIKFSYNAAARQAARVKTAKKPL